MNIYHKDLAIILGLGFFLFGIRFLSFYIRTILNKRVRDKIQFWIQNDIAALLLGGVLIAVTQSVTAIIILLVNLIKSNVVTKNKAVFIVIGANIFSFFIIFLISSNIILAVMIVLGLSGIIYALADRKEIQNIAGSLFGIGCIFYGLYNIQNGASTFSEIVTHAGIFQFVKEYYIGEFLLGVILSFISHSSIVVVILAISFAKVGYFNLEDLIIITYGANIGTTLLILLTTMKVKGDIRQLISFQLYYKVISSVILIPIFYIENYTKIPMVTAGINALTHNVANQATIAYFIFNTLPLVFFWPLNKKISLFLEHRFPKTIADIYSRPQFILDTKYLDSFVVLELIELEQIRIVKSFSIYFDELRTGKDTEKLKVLSTATNDLAAFIRDEISYLLNEKNLSMDDFIKLNQLLIREHIINRCFTTLLSLSSFLFTIKIDRNYASFFRSVTESMDIITLLVLNIIENNDKEDLDFLKQITSAEEGGVANMRRIYFKDAESRNRREQALLLNIINQCEIISFLLQDLAKTYLK